VNPTDPHPAETAEAVEEFGDGQWWWACSQPERPPDAECCWLWKCDACTLHMIAAVAVTPDDPDDPVYAIGATSDGRPRAADATPAEMLAEARSFRAQWGLRPL
jgi:hypothetical protein